MKKGGIKEVEMQLLAQCRPQDRNGGSCARVANGHHGYYWHESIRGAILLLEREGGLRWARVASLILSLYLASAIHYAIT